MCHSPVEGHDPVVSILFVFRGKKHRVALSDRVEEKLAPLKIWTRKYDTERLLAMRMPIGSARCYMVSAAALLEDKSLRNASPLLLWHSLILSQV